MNTMTSHESERKPVGAASPPASSLWRDMLRNRLVVAGVLIVGSLIMLALLAPALTYMEIIRNPLAQFPRGLDGNGLPVAPNGTFRLGTDSLGRDMLSRVIYGARVSLTIGIVAMLTAVCIGTSVGVLAGYFGSWINVGLMRGTDVMMSIPGLILAIAFAGLMDGRIIHLHPSWLAWHFLDLTLKRGLVSVFLVIGIVSWTWIARVIRGQVLAIKEREFVEASRAIGCSHRWIILHHILPNVAPTIVVLATLSTAGTVLLDAGLSYLGVGVPPPSPSWGTMIADGQPYFIVAPYITFVPGVAIVLTVVGFNLLGQGLQDVLDPYAKGKK